MRIGNVSFGSTYAIKYNYTLMKAYGYATPDNEKRNFIDAYNAVVKDKNEISAINPETKTYFIKMPNEKDVIFEGIVNKMSLKSKFRKVNDKKMNGAVITSVGPTKNEIYNISHRISNYEHLKTLEKESFLP